MPSTLLCADDNMAKTHSVPALHLVSVWGETHEWANSHKMLCVKSTENAGTPGTESEAGVMFSLYNYKTASETTRVVFCLLLQTYVHAGSMTIQATHTRLHTIVLTQIGGSFPTFTLGPRHGWEAHVVVGPVLGRGVRHGRLWLGLCLLPVVATSLLPPSTHRLWRSFLRWAERWKSPTQSSWCGGFAGKWRTTYRKKGEKEGNAIFE